METLIHGKIQFSKDEWQNLVIIDLDDDTVDGQMMFCMSQLPSLIQRGRAALLSPIRPNLALQETISEAYRLQDKYQPILGRLRERWKRTEMESTTSGQVSLQHRLPHCHYSKMLAHGLAIGILINCICGPLANNERLSYQDSNKMSEEMLGIADLAVNYRPLGSMAMIIFLSAAWVGATDLELKMRIESRAEVFHKDIYGPEATFTTKDFEQFQLF